MIPFHHAINRFNESNEINESNRNTRSTELKGQGTELKVIISKLTKHKLLIISGLISVKQIYVFIKSGFFKNLKKKNFCTGDYHIFVVHFMFKSC